MVAKRWTDDSPHTHDVPTSLLVPPVVPPFDSHPAKGLGVRLLIPVAAEGEGRGRVWLRGDCHDWSKLCRIHLTDWLHNNYRETHTKPLRWGSGLWLVVLVSVFCRFAVFPVFRSSCIRHQADRQTALGPRLPMPDWCPSFTRGLPRKSRGRAYSARTCNTH